MSFPIKLPLMFSGLVLAAVAFASPAIARDGHHGHGNHGQHHGRQDRGRQDRGHDRRGNADHRDYRRGHDRTVYVPGWRRPAYRVQPRPQYRRVAPVRAYYRAPAPRWVRGGRYYGTGYAPTYVVNDYGYYGLRQPPRGYYWRRDDRGEFLLVAIATGIIADLVLHGGY